VQESEGDSIKRSIRCKASYWWMLRLGHQTNSRASQWIWEWAWSRVQTRLL